MVTNATEGYSFFGIIMIIKNNKQYKRCQKNNKNDLDRVEDITTFGGSMIESFVP